MRELPLNDLNWLKENAKVEFSKEQRHYVCYGINTYRACKILIKFPNICKLHTSFQRVGMGVCRKIYWDTNTNELFKWYYTTSNEELIDNLFRCNLISKSDYTFYNISDKTGVNIIIQSKYKYVFDYDYHKSIDNIIHKFYENHGIDTEQLTSASLTNFKIYTKNFLTKIIKDIKEQNKDISTLINSAIKNDNCTKYEEIYDVERKVNNEAISNWNDVIINKLEEKIDYIMIKYLLLRNDTTFSGANSQINFFRYSGNKKENTFDIMEIQIMMLSNYQENLKFIKSNPEKIRSLLREIVECHSRSKKYANYLKLYDLVLTRGNILVAKFCFKDGLDELCK